VGGLGKSDKRRLEGIKPEGREKLDTSRKLGGWSDERNGGGGTIRETEH